MPWPIVPAPMTATTGLVRVTTTAPPAAGPAAGAEDDPYTGRPRLTQPARPPARSDSPSRRSRARRRRPRIDEIPPRPRVERAGGTHGPRHVAQRTVEEDPPANLRRDRMGPPH